MIACRDCKWLSGRICYNPLAVEVDVVYGTQPSSAFLTRAAGKCGMDAKYFEPRPLSLFQRIKRFLHPGRRGRARADGPDEDQTASAST